MFHTLRKRKSLAVVLMVVGLLFTPLSFASVHTFADRIIPNTEPKVKSSDRKVVKAYIHKVNPKLSTKLIDKLMLAVDRNVKMYGLPEDLQLGIIALESGFKPYAQGPTGDIGYWQVVPKYHTKMIDRMYRQGIIKNKNMTDTYTNTAIGGKVLYDCLLKNNWYVKPALLCYNGSVNDDEAKYAKLVLKRVNNVVVAKQ
jgi:soluble lytic murein transglycosylase-like protein